MHLLRTARSYLQAAPRILILQLLSKGALGVIGFLLNKAATWALSVEGRVAVTTGDFRFLFTDPAGILLLVLGLATLYLYVAIDLNVMVAFAGHWVRDEKFTLRQVVREGVASLRHFFSPSGLLVVLYIALIAPIIGVGSSISLTEHLKVPSFISSVIMATPLYRTAYYVAFAIFTLIGYLAIFIIHGVVLDDLPVKRSMRQSGQLMRAHWKNYIGHSLRFALLCVLAGVLVLALSLALSFAIVVLIVASEDAIHGVLPELDIRRLVLLFVYSHTCCILADLLLIGAPFTSIKMAELYLKYTTGQKPGTIRHKRKYGLVLFGEVLLVIMLSALFAIGGTLGFDEFFPQTSNVQVIAHRACGNEGTENSAAGLAVAEAAGAWGAEIDIQRTSDGAYVVNHDNDFARVAGDRRKPSEMTLKEVRALQVRANPADPQAPATQVSTYEEMLDGALAHHLVLFVELKGQTADHQMADDAVRIARERGAFDQCVFISLDYELIDYLEDHYPEAQTGFLAFAGYGDTASLHCDYLALEELAATPDIIDVVHDQGKKMLVWTVNDRDSQEHFLCTEADAIITDNMTQAEEERAELANRDDMARVIDTSLNWWFQ